MHDLQEAVLVFLHVVFSLTGEVVGTNFIVVLFSVIFT